jgi:uncharacterized membrane protein YbhN (UPF0104 family)
VGTFELTVVAIADGLGIPRDSAFALGLLVHLVILGTTSIGGGIAMLARRGWERERKQVEQVGVA